jgi:hypothetical protein
MNFPVQDGDEMPSASLDMSIFIKGPALEMLVAFPHFRFVSDNLLFKYGQFLGQEGAESLVDPSRFQVSVFRDCLNKRWDDVN